jgi:hypothetical protein
VGPKVGMGVFTVFLASYLVVGALGSACLLLIGQECASLDQSGVMATWAPVC